MLTVMREVKPYVLIGTSTKPQAFREEITRGIAKLVQQSIVFPLSNPTGLHEAYPKDINRWTEGRALIATGSPFPPINREGSKYETGEILPPREPRLLVVTGAPGKTIAVCNNSTCFPGIGLGAVLSRTRVVSNQMLVAAVKALAARSPALQNPNQPLLPDVEDAREISVDVARAVIKTAVKDGYGPEKDITSNDEDLDRWIRVLMWEPVYRPLVGQLARQMSPFGQGKRRLSPLEATEAKDR